MPPDHITKILSRLDWRTLRIVLAVAKSKSLRQAAHSTGLSEGTLSKYVGSLEQHLGICLFERTAHGMILTDSGQHFIGSLEKIEDQLEAAIETAYAAQDAPEGNVRITTVPCLANRVLVARSATLFHQYPKLNLELIAIPNDLNLSRREADIALRLARPSQDMNMLARKIGMLEYAVYCIGDVDEATEKKLPWISYETDMLGLPPAEWIANHTAKSEEIISNLRCNDADGLIEAIRSGHGKSLLPRIVAAQLPDLKEIGPFPDLPSREIWLMTHPNLAQAKRIQLVVDWLCNIFEPSGARY